MLDLQNVVVVAGFCFVVGLVSPAHVTVPLLLALVFQEFRIEAAFVGMVVSLPLGFVARMAQGSR